MGWGLAFLEVFAYLFFVPLKLNRHLREAQENLVEPGSHGSQVIHNNNCHTHINWQMF